MKISSSTKPSGTWPKPSASKESDWLQAPGSGTGVRRFLATIIDKALALETWASRRCHPQIRDGNRNMFRVKILELDGVTLPRRRHVVYGYIVSASKHASRKSPPINQSSRDFLAINPISQLQGGYQLRSRCRYYQEG